MSEALLTTKIDKILLRAKQDELRLAKVEAGLAPLSRGTAPIEVPQVMEK